jgi:hypothetical protein
MILLESAVSLHCYGIFVQCRQDGGGYLREDTPPPSWLHRLPLIPLASHQKTGSEPTKQLSCSLRSSNPHGIRGKGADLSLSKTRPTFVCLGFFLVHFRNLVRGNGEPQVKVCVLFSALLRVAVGWTTEGSEFDSR